MIRFARTFAAAAVMACAPVWAELEAPAPVVPRVLDLATAQRIALDANPNLMAAEARIRQAQARVRQSRSTFFPQVIGQTSLSKTELSDKQLAASRAGVLSGQVQALTGQFQSLAFTGNLGGGPLSFITPAAVWGIQTAGLLDIDESTEQYGVTLGATWLLFDGFEREFSYRAARFARQESEEALREGQRMLLSAVAAAYYQAQLNHENIAIALADEAFNERLVKEAEARQRAGSGSLSDVLNFEVQANEADAQRIDAERAYRVALIGLAELMGAPDAFVAPDQELVVLESERPEEMTMPDVDTALELAKTLRPDLSQAGYAVRRAQATVNARRGAFYPEVSASVSRDAFRTDDYDFDRGDFSTTFGLTMTYTFFAGGRNVALVSEARALRSEYEYTRDALEIEVAADVRTALANLRAAQESLMLQRKNAEFVKRNRDLVEKGYAADQESLVRLTQAERDYTAARVRLTVALVSLRSAWHDLRTATGEVLAAAES